MSRTAFSSAGAPSPAEVDERTIQLDIYSLMLGGHDGFEQVLISMWDLAGQPQYAAGLQPYIVSGSLYLLLVPAMPIAELDKGYGDLVGRWMDYLTAGAPEAVVQPVLTHCDTMLPQHAKDTSAKAFEDATRMAHRQMVATGATRVGARAALATVYTRRRHRCRHHSRCRQCQVDE